MFKWLNFTVCKAYIKKTFSKLKNKTMLKSQLLRSLQRAPDQQPHLCWEHICWSTG